MARQNSRVFILIFLGMLTAFGPFVTDMYLPTFPEMADFFHTSSSMVQLGLTASMIGLAAGQLFFGPLSDKYGRRPLLIAGMFLFLVSTLGCVYSQTALQFVGWRLVQGIAGASGIVISRSIAADKYAGRELAKMLGIIGAINGVAPVAAPMGGGMLAESIGWQGIFWCLFCIGILLLAGSFHLTESLPAANRRKTDWTDVFRGFGAVLRNRQYLCYILQFGFAQGVLFANISSAPFIMQAGNCLLGGIICQVPPSGAGTLSRKPGHAGRFHPPAGSDGFLVQLLDLRNIVALPVGDAGADIHIVQHLSHERRTPTCRNGIRGIGCVRLCFWRHCFSVGGYRRHHAFYRRHVRHRLIGRLSMRPHLPEQSDEAENSRNRL